MKAKRGIVIPDQHYPIHDKKAMERAPEGAPGRSGSALSQATITTHSVDQGTDRLTLLFSSHHAHLDAVHVLGVEQVLFLRVGGVEHTNGVGVEVQGGDGAAVVDLQGLHVNE